MKRVLIVLAPLFFVQITFCQNVGIGTKEPVSKLQVGGNLLVSEPLTATSTAPTVAQTKTMVNGTTVPFSPSDSVMRFYDPGGPSGSYLANLNGDVQVSYPASAIAHEVTFESMDLGSGDSLIISQAFGFGSTILMAVGNGYTATGKWTFNTTNGTLYFLFKSNADGNLGAGFSILVRRLYSTPSSLPAVNNYHGKAMFFDTKTGSLRSGLVSDDSRGIYSVAFGQVTVASGGYAFAAGSDSKATGTSSVAIGENCNATNTRSVAIGSATASGMNAVALGNGTASGAGSFSVGFQSTASGGNAVALGSQTDAAGSSATALGRGTNAYGYATTAVGMYNNPLFLGGQTSVTPTTPMFIIGNGESEAVSNAMVVLKNGNAGIGEDQPVTKLHINGGTDASLSDVSGYIVVGDINGTNLVFDNNEMMARNNGANATLFLQNSGGAFEIGGTAAKPGGGSWLATSDARLKQNIQPYNDGLQTLLKINPVQFQYNQLSGYNTQQEHIGVVAQELKAVAPYMVSIFAKDNTDYLKVDNSAMTYMLINAVKELSKQNEELKQRLQQLEALIKQNTP